MTDELQWFCDKHDYRNRENRSAPPPTRCPAYG